MIKSISLKFAGTFMLALLSCVLVFHLLVLFGVIPYNVVWGGRLESDLQMYLFETVSIAINMAVIAIVGMRMGHIQLFIPDKAVTALLWVMTALFSLNTLGNLFSVTVLEAVLFTPVTLVSAIFCYRMAVEGRVSAEA